MKTVLITRPRQQSAPFAESLRKAGFEPRFFPVIQIRPMEDLGALKDAISRIHEYDWVIFSSVNAVNVFFDAAPSLRPPPQGERTSPFPPRGKVRKGAKIAAIGSKTASALRSHGVDVDFVPEKYVGESLLAGLVDLRGKWILLPRAKVAREIVPREIAKAGGIVHEIAIYETVQAEIDKEGISALRAGVDAVTFTSPSTVNNFVDLTKKAGLDPLHLPNNPLFACIGPVTEKAARKAGFSPIVVAEEYTTDGLIDVISEA